MTELPDYNLQAIALYSLSQLMVLCTLIYNRFYGRKK
jgi:hypothetical protein